MKLKPIRTKAEHEKALATIDALMDKSEDDVDAMNDLEVLAILVEAYEEEHYPIAPPDPLAAIEFAFEQRGSTPAERVRIFGSKSRMSEVMSRKRALSLAMRQRAHAVLGVPAAVLLNAPKRTKARSQK